jgi:hypothetical protein
MCFKITSAQREYYHYTGFSAELERRGLGCSRPKLAWVSRFQTQKIEADDCDRSIEIKAAAAVVKRKADTR